MNRQDRVEEGPPRSQHEGNEDEHSQTIGKGKGDQGDNDNGQSKKNHFLPVINIQYFPAQGTTQQEGGSQEDKEYSRIFNAVLEGVEGKKGGYACPDNVEHESDNRRGNGSATQEGL